MSSQSPQPPATSGADAPAASALPPATDAPWLQPQLAQLRRARDAGRFPSALLIHGQPGAGAEAVAAYATRLVLCREPRSPCGHCRDCRQLEAAQHPDFFAVSPIEDSKQIRVEQIRELCEQLALTAHGGHGSVALISPADSMNANAANALLKTLEEPRAGVTLILVSAVPSRLAATIRSRCQRLRVGVPARAQSLAWLRQRGGPEPWEVVLDVLGEAPFRALSLDAGAVARLHAETGEALDQAVAGRLDIARTADGWGRAESYELRLACLENWLTARIDDVIGVRRQRAELRNGAHLSEAGSDLNMAKWLRALDGVQELRRLRLSSINRPLALEQLLWSLAGAQGAVARRRGV